MIKVLFFFLFCVTIDTRLVCSKFSSENVTGVTLLFVGFERVLIKSRFELKVHFLWV